MTIGITPVGSVAARQWIRDNVVGATGAAIDIHEPLFTSIREGHIGGVRDAIADVFVDIANGLGGAVSMVDNGVGATTIEHLAGTILIPVESHGIPLFVGTIADIGTTVDPPQATVVDAGSINFDLTEHLVVVGGEEIILIGLVLALHNEVYLTIAINVAQRNVVDHVVGHRRRGIVLFPHGHATTSLHVGNGKFEILILPGSDGCTLCLLYPIAHSSHGILTGSAAAGIGIVGSIEVLSYQRTVAIQLIGDAIILVGLYTPTDKHALRNLDGHQATIKLVGLTLG